jgi:uncharacterized repeat protein (TIGR01451 family)
VKGNGSSAPFPSPSLSADGIKVAFESSATNLDPGDTDTIRDVYVKDLVTGDITLASTSDAGIKANGRNLNVSLSDEGTMVAFTSNATNLEPADTDTISDVYAKELGPAPAGTADLSLTKSDSPDPVDRRQRLKYRIAVKNAGPDAATGVTITDTLPKGVSFVSAILRQGSCAVSGRVVTCDLGTIRSGAGAIVRIVVIPTRKGIKSNTASVTANETDPTPANNTDTEMTTVR